MGAEEGALREQRAVGGGPRPEMGGRAVAGGRVDRSRKKTRGVWPPAPVQAGC